MPTFACSLIVRAERAFLFNLTQDYSRRLAWDVFLASTALATPNDQHPACEPGASPGMVWAWRPSTSPSNRHGWQRCG